MKEIFCLSTDGHMILCMSVCLVAQIVPDASGRERGGQLVADRDRDAHRRQPHRYSGRCRCSAHLLMCITCALLRTTSSTETQLSPVSHPWCCCYCCCTDNLPCPVCLLGLHHPVSGLKKFSPKSGSPTVPMPGYDVRVRAHHVNHRRRLPGDTCLTALPFALMSGPCEQIVDDEGQEVRPIRYVAAWLP